MDWIDECIAIGNLLDAENVEDLKEQDIDIVLDARLLFDLHIETLGYVPKIEKILRTGNLLVSLSDLKARCLIHCIWGKDRTPFVAMVYIALKYKKSYKDAYDFVKEKHPSTVIHWEWCKMLKDEDLK